MNKNTTYRIFLLLLWSIVLPSFGGAGGGYAQQPPEPDFAWAKRFGNSTFAQRSMYAPSLAVDSQGNSYVSGIILDQSFTLDGITLTGDAHRNNGYIAKYDPNGQIIWAKSTRHIVASAIASTEYNFQKIIVDKNGNIYICGTYKTDGQSIINGHYLNPDAPVGNTAHSSSYFLAKLNADGEILWTKITLTLNFGSFFNRRFQNEIHFDLEGNINMTGRFTNYITFDTNDTLTTATDKSGVFLAKYSPQGELLLNKKLEGDSYHQEQTFESVRSDASGNLYRWSNYEDYNGDIIGMKKLYRYDPLGELQDSLILNIESTNITSYTRNTNLRGFAVSPTGDVFVGGYYYGGLKINDINYGGYHGTNDHNAVLIKLSAPDYQVEWVRNNITTGIMTSFDKLLTDALGNVYTAGRTGTLNNLQMLFRKYTDSGELLWEKSINGLYTPQTPNLGSISPYALCQTKNGGNIWISGTFLANVYFGEGYHYYTAPTGNGSHYNSFLVQYGLCDTANPVIDTPATMQLCEGGSLTLSATLSDTELTYFWSTPTGTVTIEDVGTATLTVTQPGKYYLVAQEDVECYGKSQEVWVTQVALPVGEVNLDDNTLSAQYGSEELTYQWLDCDNNNYPIEGATNQSFTPLVSGTYAVEVTNTSGCSVVSECIEVCNLAVPIVETPVATAFCEGDSIVLTALLTNPDLIYIWNTPQGSITIEDISSNTLTVTQAGDYSLTAQENETCFATSEIISITENPLPVGEVNLDDNTLSAQYGSEELTYQWLDCDNNNYPIEGATNQSFTPLVSGSYAVEVTNASGCSVVSECIEVCNLAVPIVETPVATAFCEGDSIVLTAQLTDPDLIYIWNTPQGSIIIEDISSNTLTVIQAGDYSLTAQENETCFATSEIISITENPLPVGEVNLDDNTLSAQYGSEELTYQWLDCDNNNYPIEGATNQSFTPLVSGSYAVEVTNASGCSVVSECIEVCNLAVPIVEPPVATAFCEGDSIVLTALLTNPDLIYIWNTPQGSITIEDISSNTLTVTQAGDYSLTAQENETCFATSEIISITENPLPVGEVNLDDNTLSAQYGSEELTYQWLDCDNNNYPIEGATNQSFTPLVSGTYAVEVTNASGCSVVSECYNVNVLGVKDIEQNTVKLYPNPATTSLFLETPLEVKRITIINMAGQIVLKSRNSKEIDVSALPQGYYIITAKTDKGRWKGKFIKK